MVGGWRSGVRSFAIAVVCGGTAAFGGGCQSSDPGDDDSVADPGPCPGGGWGSVTAGMDGVFVAPDGSDEAGDGSEAAPFATIAAALAHTRDHPERRQIVVLPGTYRETLALMGSPIGGHATGDGGLRIEGCGAEGEEAAVIAHPDVEDADLGPVVRVTSLGDEGVRLAGLRLEGGRRALYLGAASEGAPVEVDGVIVRGAARVGISVDGHDTIAVLSDVVVEEVVPEEAGSGLEIGYGIGVNLGRLTMAGGRVEGATAVGIFVQGQLSELEEAASGRVDLVGVTVSDTRADGAGRLGRAVHLQGATEAALTDVDLEGSRDAGLFAIGCASVVLDRVRVSGADGAEIPDEQGGGTSGDGIVVTSVVDPADGFGPEGFAVSLADCSVEGATRGGIVLETVEAEIGAGVDAVGDGQAGEVLAQGGSVLSGEGAGLAVVPDVPLSFNRTALAGDDIGLGDE